MNEKECFEKGLKTYDNKLSIQLNYGKKGYIYMPLTENRYLESNMTPKDFVLKAANSLYEGLMNEFLLDD